MCSMRAGGAFPYPSLRDQLLPILAGVRSLP
jgi:hypothetical protein